jgi:hypothetical protein
MHTVAAHRHRTLQVKLTALQVPSCESSQNRFTPTLGRVCAVTAILAFAAGSIAIMRYHRFELGLCFYALSDAAVALKFVLTIYRAVAARFPWPLREEPTEPVG